MRILVSAAALAAAFGCIGSASAQTESAIGDAGLRPMDITCADLNAASESERSGLVYFLAGYQAAQDQAGQNGMTTGALGTGGADAISGAADATATADTTADAGADTQSTTADTTGTDTASADPATGAATDTDMAADADTATADAAATDTPAVDATADTATTDTADASATATDTTTADATADTAMADTGAATDTAGTADEGTDMAAAGDGADAGWDVSVSRSFFATPVEEILAACEGNDQMTALDAIGQARSAAQ